MSPTLIWAIVGVALLIAEMFTGTFVLLFLGIAAIVVAGLRLIGLDHLSMEILIFAVVSLLQVFFFRKKIKYAMSKTQTFSIDQEGKLILSVDVPAHSEVQITYQGSVWTAVNDTDQNMQRGERAKIMRTEGIKLIIAPLSS
jgi:membrane protein implicated in regulation of membrane protease activity